MNGLTKLFIPLMLTLLCVAFIGCGKQKTNVADEPASTVSYGDLAVSNTIDSNTVSSITRVVSPAGAVDFGKPIPLYKSVTPVMALDAEGKIRLGGFVTANTKAEMTIESTALLLVRLVLEIPEDVSSAQMNDFIKKADKFGVLMTLVDGAVKAGKAPQDDANVPAAILLVVDQVSDLLMSSRSVGTAAITVLPVEPAAEGSPPYYLVKNPGQLGSVYMDSAFRVTNSMPISWSIQSKSASGANLGAPILFKGASLLQRLNSAIGAYGNTKMVERDGVKSFAITVEQNESTRLENLQDITASLVKEVLPIAVSNKCLSAITPMLVPPDQMAKLIVQPSFDVYSEYLGKLFSGEIKPSFIKTTDMVVECGGIAQDKLYQNVTEWVKASLGVLLPVYKAVEKGLKYASIGERMWQTAHYWSADPENLTVCVGSNGAIANCARRFEIQGGNLIMVPGDVLPVSFDAFDKAGSKTLVPAEIEVVSSNPLAVDIMGTASEDKKFGSSYPGVASVRMKDVATGKYTDRNVESVDLQFDVSELRVSLGQISTVKLVDPQGRKVTTSNSRQLFEITADSDDIAILPNPFSDGGIIIQPKKLGEAVLQAKNLMDGAITKVNVYIDCPEGYFETDQEPGTCSNYGYRPFVFYREFSQDDDEMFVSIDVVCRVNCEPKKVHYDFTCTDSLKNTISRSYDVDVVFDASGNGAPAPYEYQYTIKNVLGHLKMVPIGEATSNYTYYYKVTCGIKVVNDNVIQRNTVGSFSTDLTEWGPQLGYVYVFEPTMQ